MREASNRRLRQEPYDNDESCVRVTGLVWPDLVGLIRRVEVTTANVHDALCMVALEQC